MNVSKVFLAVCSLLLLRCKKASLIEEQESAMYDAISSGSVQELENVLDGFQGNFYDTSFEVYDEKSDSEIMLSPLQVSIACNKPEIMSFMIESKSPVINLDTFVIVFKSGCLECFDILLDHSTDLLSWNFNQRIVERIIKYSVNNFEYIAFISKFCKYIGFNDKLGLIEKVFEKCTEIDLDHGHEQDAVDSYEKISITIDVVILNIISIERENGTSLFDERAAVYEFSRAMIYKKDFVELFVWIDSQLNQFQAADKKN